MDEQEIRKLGWIKKSEVLDWVKKEMDKTFERQDVWHGGELDFVLFKRQLLEALSTKDILKVRE